jgi:hypothetical protein
MYYKTTDRTIAAILFLYDFHFEEELGYADLHIFVFEDSEALREILKKHEDLSLPICSYHIHIAKKALENYLWEKTYQEVWEEVQEENSYKKTAIHTE